MAALITGLCNALRTFEYRCATYLRWTFQPNGDDSFPHLHLDVLDRGDVEQLPRTTSARDVLDDIIGDGFLWGVPKARKTLERRRTKWLSLGKQIQPKRNLVPCDVCGHFREGHTICGNCYEKVQAETIAIQEAINGSWKCDAVDTEVVAVYDNDTKDDQFWKGKRIVEMKRERPQWFHHNLQQRTNQAASDAASNALHPSKSIITQVK